MSLHGVHHRDGIVDLSSTVVVVHLLNSHGRVVHEVLGRRPCYQILLAQSLLLDLSDLPLLVHHLETHLLKCYLLIIEILILRHLLRLLLLLLVLGELGHMRVSLMAVHDRLFLHLRRLNPSHGLHFTFAERD